MQMKSGTIIAALGLLMLSGRQMSPSLAAFKYVHGLKICATRFVPHDLERTIVSELAS